MKNLENVLLLMDLLAGRIPLDTFKQQAYFQFKERVFSKRNVKDKLPFRGSIFAEWD
jgi:hypothetical protein